MHAVLFVIKGMLSGAIQGTSVTQRATLSSPFLSVWSSRHREAGSSSYRT